MANSVFRIKGHESFIPREGWLNKGIHAVAQDPAVFARNAGADTLGVGTNMAKSIRYWLKVMGLTIDAGGRGVTLSELGEIIARNDPYIEDVFTLWVLHTNLARNQELATSWFLFFNEIDVSVFKREELTEMMMDRLLTLTGADSLPERSVKDDCSAILSMYCPAKEKSNDPEDKNASSPFAQLGLLTAQGKDGYEKIRPAADAIDPLLVYYILSDKLLAAGFLSIDELVYEVNMPGKVLNLNRVILNDHLDALQNQGHIIVNRTAGLDVIYPDSRITAIDAISLYYGGQQ